MVTWYVHEVDGGYVLEMGGCSACFLGAGLDWGGGLLWVLQNPTLLMRSGGLVL